MATSTTSSSTSSLCQLEESSMFVNFEPDGSPDYQANQLLFGEYPLLLYIPSARSCGLIRGDIKIPQLRSPACRGSW